MATDTATDISAAYDIPEERIFKDQETDVEAEVMGGVILQDMLNSLTSDERNAVMLCILGGYSDREAGLVMEKHESSVRRCRLKAQKKMRNYMENVGLENYASAKAFLSEKAVSEATENNFPVGEKVNG